MKNKTLQVRTEDGQHERWEALAKKRGITVSELVRETMDEATSQPCRACHGTGRKPKRKA